MLRIAVITISDRASRGEYEDRSGPAVAAVLGEALPDAELRTAVVADEEGMIRTALEAHLDCDVILTSGGTGLSPRDVTPEACRAFCEREIPGVAEWLRQESRRETPFAVFSRGFCGSRGRTIVVNLPGSVRGAEFCARLLAPVLEHARAMILGQGH